MKLGSMPAGMSALRVPAARVGRQLSSDGYFQGVARPTVVDGSKARTVCGATR